MHICRVNVLTKKLTIEASNCIKLDKVHVIVDTAVNKYWLSIREIKVEVRHIWKLNYVILSTVLQQGETPTNLPKGAVGPFITTVCI